VSVKKREHHIPIRISGLSDGEHVFELTAVPGEIGLPKEFESELAVDVRMDKTHSQLILHIRVRAEAAFLCDRCLEKLCIPIDTSFMLFYARDLAAARQLDEDDVRIIEPHEPLIDIGGDVRDFALLAVPMRRVCGEFGGNPDCVAPSLEERLAGAQVSSDPRWEPLKKLASKKRK